ncbi:uncharacterized protein C6orf136 homolog [Tetranychus urticae]|uniref:Uncharacterized protein n=1 Tax=Tetranychus urticae TaxID=32264 RepID=T1KVL4_TETUR|nr:uncharacterized protein C6orf136 homolog [Tetranychus urticae]
MITGKPSISQLKLVYTTLSEYLPNFFRGPHCFEIYAEDVVLEDNIRNIKTVGLPVYKQNISLVKFYSHLKYRHVDLNVLKMTEHIEESCVKVRWRVVGSPNWTILLNYLSSLPSVKGKNLADNDVEVWVDGFSIFYVNKDGKICRHICDKLIPDDNYEDNGGPKRLFPNLTGKLTTFSTPNRPRSLTLCC